MVVLQFQLRHYHGRVRSRSSWRRQTEAAFRLLHGPKPPPLFAEV